MHPSSSHYRSSGYDDLKLPPIRDPSYASTTRARSSARYVTLEPPTHISTAYPRNVDSVTLPPLRSAERSSIHAQAPLPPIAPTPRRTQTEHMPPLPSPYRPSTSHHHRSNSMSEDYEPSSSTRHAYSSQSPTSMQFSQGYSPSSALSPIAPKAYSCDICGASFSRAYDCKRHRDIHTRQGGHECPYCHKTLSRADALKRHMERGCTGMEEEDEELDRERERERRERRDKRSSMGVLETNSKHYYSSSSTRQR